LWSESCEYCAGIELDAVADEPVADGLLDRSMRRPFDVVVVSALVAVVEVDDVVGISLGELVEVPVDEDVLLAVELGVELEPVDAVLPVVVVAPEAVLAEDALDALDAVLAVDALAALTTEETAAPLEQMLPGPLFERKATMMFSPVMP
jgi:hypothetical protein